MLDDGVKAQVQEDEGAVEVVELAVLLERSMHDGRTPPEHAA
jgi:hypothetical protein